MRDLIKVTTGMCNEIPSENQEIKINILSTIENVRWAPPEKLNSPFYWKEIANVLSQYISAEDYDTKEWCKRVIDIFQDPNYGNNDIGYCYR